MASPSKKGAEKIKDDLYCLRHSLAHILAQAVLQVRPKAKLAFGPPVDDGFYYDFDFAGEPPLGTDDFADLEERMKKIIKENQKFEMRELSIPDAVSYLESRGEVFKVEHAQKLGQDGHATISFWKNGPFEDLCEGPHVESTNKIARDLFKLDRVSGAYWRGDEKPPHADPHLWLGFPQQG